MCACSAENAARLRGPIVDAASFFESLTGTRVRRGGSERVQAVALTLQCIRWQSREVAASRPGVAVAVAGALLSNEHCPPHLPPGFALERRIRATVRVHATFASQLLYLLACVCGGVCRRAMCSSVDCMLRCCAASLAGARPVRVGWQGR
jgi:hypothetical protein